MKKRAVSPVIATVLLIALVTAAAAIVFLVVIPMLTPANAILTEVSSIDQGDGNFSITIRAAAQASDVVFNGTVAVSPTVTYLAVSSTTPVTIENGESKDITIIGSFSSGVKCTITLTFIAGGTEFSSIIEVTPT
ncbi:MAG: hypothetical protein KAS63_03375 [Candidatus Heimdallarchaeota archaeon]|nr:hypothetical protein [Candidatus Heimdallarchaeota archaeon]MCK4954378.1 hypothetical protein [Candidatus Heimdallarchaeota archaeon]